LIRTVDDSDIAWYLWLTSETVSEIPSKDQFTNLVWSDDFDYTGAIDPDKWTHEVREQWYNNEVQSTTNSLDNSKVEDGKLKITAIKTANGSFTSARIRTYKKLDFTYGRIDVKAKMPSKTNGVWPAIWLLGSNYESIDWPACGEIDIQEYAHTNSFNVQSTVHQPEGYAGQGDSHVTYDYNNIDEEFHVYSLVWTKEALTFYVDDKPHHIVGNSCALPFNWDFYLILNFAMGGDMGGDIDSSFTSETMEIDYVKVYQ
jgi:beta-glucanase (GH16 family)